MDIWECVLGFMDAQVLLTAEELGVFDHLAAGRDTAEAVAEATEMPVASARRLLTALCALGIVEKRADGRFANSPEAAEKLVRGEPGYIGAMFHHVRDDLYPVWGHFKEALQEGQAQWKRAFGEENTPNEAMFDDPAALRSFMEGMHAITYRAAAEFAAQAPELEDVGHIVDVGGASGAFLIALAQAFPHLQGTVFDLPQVQPIAEDFIAQHDLADRLRFAGGNFWEDPLPAGADAYALGFILHDWDTEGGAHLLGKVAEASRPGSRLIIGEYLLNDDRTGPLHVARQDLNMLVAARGQERSAGEYADWAGSFGYTLERIQPTSHGKHFMIFQR